jgi:UDP-glucose 4-epimerase
MDVRDFGISAPSTKVAGLPDLLGAFRGKRVSITGGCGFLGSTLAQRLVRYGAEVTVVDSLHPLYGGNPFNLRGCETEIEMVIGDLRDPQVLRRCVDGSQVIFHLAAQVSYIDSLNMPLDDLALNAGVTLQLLEECRRQKVSPTFVFASSRMALGRVEGATLTEETPANPLSLYGVHKYASERYLSIYHQNFGVPTIALRITNPYGPRQQIHHSKYSLVGWFIRQALEDQTIRVFGDGEQTRDYIYIDDLADGFLRCAVAPDAVGRLVNVGSGVATRFRDMVCTVVDVVGRGRVEFTPWPKDYAKLETGDIVADLSLLRRLTGWHSHVELRSGIERTTEYYRRHWRHYVARSTGTPAYLPSAPPRRTVMPQRPATPASAEVATVRSRAALPSFTRHP